MSLPSMVWQKKAEKKALHLVFDEDDDILEGIESAMREHAIEEATLVTCTGSIKSGLGNYLQGNQIMTKQFNNTQVKSAVGHFKVSAKGCLGILKFIPLDLDNHVTVAKGKAGPDFEVKLSYYVF